MSSSSEIVSPTTTDDKQPADDDAESSSLLFYRFLRDQIPKIELHAHLNGCIPLPLLQELCAERQVPVSSLLLLQSSTSSTFWNYESPKEESFMERDDDDDDDSQPITKEMLPVFFFDNHTNPLQHPPPPRSLDDCFQIFRELPRAVNDLNAVRRITWAALSNFAYQHHVVYLELRSTPKRLWYDYKQQQTGLCTKQEYVETILEILQQFNEKEEQRYQQELLLLQQPNPNQPMIRLPMVCKFIVSIDRSQSLEQAAENIDLAIQFRSSSSRFPNTVVGVDLGGNPNSTDWQFPNVQPLFQYARNAGLKITIHCAEIPCEPPSMNDPTETQAAANDAAAVSLFREAESIIEFRPDRIGHGVLLPSVLLEKLKALHIPVETCPASNVLTLQLHHHLDNHNNNFNEESNPGHLVHGIRQHKTLQKWLQESHPLAVSTDDPGVFDTSPTQELWLLQNALALTREQMIQLATGSIRFAFCDEATKQVISERIRKHLDNLDK
jgi:adenosine deaminase